MRLDHLFVGKSRVTRVRRTSLPASDRMALRRGLYVEQCNEEQGLVFRIIPALCFKFLSSFGSPKSLALFLYWSQSNLIKTPIATDSHMAL